jgi:Ca2+-binding RTX toxin-like protein
MSMALKIGTNAGELISGTSLADEIRGLDGNDTLFGLDGDDVLLGHAGTRFVIDNDTLFGGNGNDRLDGGVGNDTLFGGAGDDLLVSGTGTDRYDGGSGVDTLEIGGHGAGTRVDLAAGQMVFGALTETVFSIENVNGSIFADQLIGDAAGNRLEGRNGNDLLVGGNGDDVLLGGAASDVLDGGFGRDILDGGTEVDTAVFTSLDVDPGVPFFQNLETGQAGVVGAVPLDTLISIENLFTTNFRDVVTGNAVANHIVAMGGDDTVDGRNGNDTLVGGAGRDTLFGGNGNDVLIGDSDNDVLQGGAGNDVLEGGTGIDLLAGGSGADRFVFRIGAFSGPDSGVGSGFRDVITDFQRGADKIDLSPIDATGSNGGNSAFTFIGGAPFSAEGQVRVFSLGGQTVVQLNTLGPSGADMEIALSGSHALSAGDFLL